MSFLDLAKLRFSSRNYKSVPVEREKLEHIVEMARIAPSAANFQPWKFYVVTKMESLETIAECYPREWFKKAPAVIVACGNHDESWKRSDGKDFCDIDLAIAIDHITLAAADLGLGSCWICNFDTVRCSRFLDLPPYMEPIALIPIAYPEDKADLDRHDKKRKPLDEVVSWDY